MDDGTRHCVQCDAPLPPRKPGPGRNRMFCDSSCAGAYHRQPVPDVPFTCAWCGSDGITSPVGRERKFCSTACRHRAHYKPSPPRPPRPRPEPIAERECSHCHSMFMPADRRRTYCGAECSKKARSDRDKARSIASPRSRADRVWRNECKTCATQFTSIGGGKRYCSEACRPKVEPRPIRPPRRAMCGACGCEFSPKGSAGYCSDDCRAISRLVSTETAIGYGNCRQCGDLFVRRVGQVGSFCSTKCSKSAHRRKRRRRLRGAATDGHTLRDVAIRDGWRCHICGRKVPDRPYSGHKMDATEDHLIPVSAGGDNLITNVRLAHMGCNSTRQDGGEVQLLLVG